MSAYLTFDDGPMYPNTERVLEILADFEVPATFFVIGQNVDANPELAARVVQEGHAIGNHSYSHPDLHPQPTGSFQPARADSARDLERHKCLAHDHAPAVRILERERGSADRELGSEEDALGCRSGGLASARDRESNRSGLRQHVGRVRGPAARRQLAAPDLLRVAAGHPGAAPGLGHALWQVELDRTPTYQFSNDSRKMLVSSSGPASLGAIPSCRCCLSAPLTRSSTSPSS
jgi:peptidoglycan/xylan/chitin deacetylase (PgdA/CDA1 family)